MRQEALLSWQPPSALPLQQPPPRRVVRMRGLSGSTRLLLWCVHRYGVSVARAHGTLRRLYLTSRPRWPCRPALHGRGGEKRPIAAILDAAALWRRRCSQNCEATVETLLDEDAAPTRFADRSFLGCRLLFPVYPWSQLRRRRTSRTRWTSSCARFRHPACKFGIVSIFCGATRVKDRPVDHPER